MSIFCDCLSFSYGAFRVLSEVSFCAENGQLTAVLGPNGVGKTTLFRCILGSLGKYEGRIEVDGKNVSAMSARERAHRIAYIPQVHAPSFGYSVMDMVLMGTAHCVGTLSQPKKEQIEAACEAMERLQIGQLSGRIFTQLSGGEQQLALIARALAQKAKTLVMDEPTASLDYGNQIHVLETVKGLAEDGYCVLLSTHNPQHAFWYADSALALFQGKVAAFGNPEDVLTAERIGELFRMKVRLIRAENGMMIGPERIMTGREAHV